MHRNALPPVLARAAGPGSARLAPARPTSLATWVAAAAWVWCHSAAAQAPAAPAPAPSAPSALEQKAERITHEDAGSRIDEVRVGGQTRSIEVQTRSAVPGYQVQPIDPNQSSDAPGAEGKSRWRVLSF